MMKTNPSAAPVASHPIDRYENGVLTAMTDLIVVEEPLEIRLVYGPEDQRKEQRLGITMRTPGQDLELVVGLLWNEGIISAKAEVLSLRHCEQVEKEEEQGNVVKVQLVPTLQLNWEKLERNFYASASCGICGKAAIEGAFQCAVPLSPPKTPYLAPEVFCQLSETIQHKQTLFTHTGGIHAAALFEANGTLLTLKEDIGRHNAVDKLIGALQWQAYAWQGTEILWLSGRAGFELIQKAMMAGISTVVAMGAPSSLAVRLAQTANMTLVGFVKRERLNVYHDPGRIIPNPGRIPRNS